MLTKKVETALNKQVEMEGYASNYYLSAASWCDSKGLPGCAQFLYGHADEERMHMMKLFHYINDAGGHALAPNVKQPPLKFKNLKDLFQSVFDHEVAVTTAINNLVDLCMNEKDHSSYNFLQWYVAEQHEEEMLFRTVLEKIELLGPEDKRGLYWIDRELGSLSTAGGESGAQG